jgi:hypothetical protein
MAAEPQPRANARPISDNPSCGVSEIRAAWAMRRDGPS